MLDMKEEADLVASHTSWIGLIKQVQQQKEEKGDLEGI